jgi:dynein heavy chain
MKTMITSVFDPFIRNMDDQEWGECDTDTKKDFINNYNKFSEEICGGLNSLNSSIEICKIDSQELEEYRSRNEESKLYERLFAEWLSTFEETLREGEGTSTKKHGHSDSRDDGPESELIFWKERLNSLTLLSELTKSNKSFCHVKNSVCSQNGKKGDDTASSLSTRYKELDNNLTEKLNEAKDNVKYLVTLEKFIEPLKHGTPDEIIETLPALMNAIKMIHTIARYYKSSTKLTTLFVKITNQMITNCKNRILGLDAGSTNVDYKMQ